METQPRFNGKSSLCILVLLRLDRMKKLLNIIFPLFLIFFLFGINFLTVKAAGNQNTHSEFSNSSSYSEFITKMDSILNRIYQMDGSFYRIEKDFQRDLNDAMQFRYHGLSHYSSTTKTDTLNFLSKLGINQTYYWTRYGSGSTAFTDSLLGIRYFLSRDELSTKAYPKRFSQDGINVYENPAAFPISFLVGKSAVLGTDVYTKNLFDLQNQLFHSLGGETERQLLIPAKNPEISLQNINTVKDENGTLYAKIDGNKESEISWTIEIDRPNLLYLYLETPDRTNDDTAEIYVDNVFIGKYLSVDRYGILPLGKFQTGTSITIKLKMLQPNLKLTQAYFYYEDWDLLLDFSKKIQENAVALSAINSSHLSGNAVVGSDDLYLFFSIPYDDDWSVSIDAETVQPIRIFDEFMAVKISSGKHTIDLQYIPKGFHSGVFISVLSIIFLIAIAAWRKNSGANDAAESI